MIAEEDNLYDDLYEDVGDTLFYKAPFQSLHENDTLEEEFKKKEGELTGKVESLLKEVEALQKDKAVLTRNISCLFKTAQMELARKDKQLKELRDENSRLKPVGTRAPPAIRLPLPIVVVPAEKSNFEKDGTEQRHRARLEGAAGVSAPDSGARKPISDEGNRGRSPLRGCSAQHQDRTPDSPRDRVRSFSGNDRRRESYGPSEHRRSRDRSRDHRDYRDSGDGVRNSDSSRKRHRS